MNDIKQLYAIYQKNPVICTDSRNVITGSIFFALKGPAFNGNAYAKAALTKGASYAVIDEKEFAEDNRYILTSDVLTTLQHLANYHRKKINIPFFAITGSNGKTTTKELIKNVLSKKYKTTATKGNLNNHIGIPLTILSVKTDDEFAVIEMGANHQKEIESYCKIVEPDYGLITNVGRAHLEGFGGFEGVKKGKGELYTWLAENNHCVFLNGDNQHLREMSSIQGFKQKIIYGQSNEFYCSGKLKSDMPFLEIEWNCSGDSGTLNTKLIGAYNFENVLSAVCVGKYFGLSGESIKEAVENYSPDNSRSQIVIKGSNTIILDAYNANPSSMEVAIKNFDKISAPHKLMFIGEMAELGEESNSEHNYIAKLISTKKFDQVILVGKKFQNAVNIVDGLFFENSADAASWLKQHPLKNAHVLIKGSRSTQMEKIMDAF